jgi:hypothetical protein
VRFGLRRARVRSVSGSDGGWVPESAHWPAWRTVPWMRSSDMYTERMLAALEVRSRRGVTGMLKSLTNGRATKPPRSSPRNERWLLRTLQRTVTLLWWLITGQSSRTLNAIQRYFRRLPPAQQSQNERKQIRRRGSGSNERRAGVAGRADLVNSQVEAKLRKRSTPPEHRHPTVEFLDIRRLGSLSVDDGVAVVMPCTDAKMGMDTAQLLAKRAGMECRILVVNDTLRQGFVHGCSLVGPLRRVFGPGCLPWPQLAP